MIIEIEEETLLKDFAEILDVNIHGHINSKYKNQRKPIVSRVGKECALKLAKGLLSYLKAFERPLKDNMSPYGDDRAER